MVNYKEILNDIVRSEENIREITQDEKMELKKCLYDMACDIDDKCREHNIHLFLVMVVLFHGMMIWISH